MKFRLMILCLLTTFLLAGCMEDDLVKNAKEMEKEYKEQIKAEEKENQKVNDKQNEILEDLKRPLDQVVSENEYDSVELNDSKDINIKNSYENIDQFALYTAKVLYDFYASNISSEVFYEFLKNYSSKRFQAETLSDKKNAIMIYENVQSIIQEQSINRESYIITKATLNKSKKEGYFYRKVSTDDGDEYYVTTLVLEDGSWKYDSDEPSIPFEIEDKELIEVKIENGGE